MSVDDNDPFNEITEGLDIVVPEGEIIDVTKLDAKALLALHRETLHSLGDRQAILNPRNDEDRELHSLYFAVMSELKKRGLK